MGIFIIIAIIFVPYLTFAGTDCRVIEYSDHFEAVCIGNPKPVDLRQPVQPEHVVPPPANTNGVGIPSRRAQKLEQIRVLGSQRYAVDFAASALESHK